MDEYDPRKNIICFGESDIKSAALYFDHVVPIEFPSDLVELNKEGLTLLSINDAEEKISSTILSSLLFDDLEIVNSVARYYYALGNYSKRKIAFLNACCQSAKWDTF